MTGMTQRRRISWILPVFTAIALVQVAPLAAQTPVESVPAVYSKAQAKLGGAIYAQKCQKCHQASGNAMGPSLKGDSFWEEWDGKPARALYSRIISTMPADDPGSLPEQDVINIVSFLLEENNLPGGDKDLQSPDALNTIQLQHPK